MQVKIKKITVILEDSGPDHVYLIPEIETPFPILQYEPSFKMVAQAGYAVEWVRKVFDREPDEIVDLRQKKDS